MQRLSRREFVSTSALAGATTVLGSQTFGQTSDANVEVLNPRMRVPLSFIIDDSTCLVNMGHFCMPQFAEAWPDRQIYKKPWKSWPREIPDAFVREFGEWCAEHDVKGKYSIVPNPACVGWLDRGLAGWSRSELNKSLKLVRELMMPNWDIHPEMITHTRVIDLKTGRPVAGANAATMENSYPQSDISVDYLASYLAYALRILKNCGLHCDGITTPGGFGNRVKNKLAQATFESVRDVFSSPICHYFKYVVSGKESPVPKIEFIGNPNADSKRFCVNVPAGTGDWFGGWDGDLKSQGHRYSNDDATSGRMIELIEQGGPAIMLCHWPGMFCQGTKAGFHDFQKIVLAIRSRFAKETIWMKISEIANYWVARELAKFEFNDGSLTINSPTKLDNLTLRIPLKKSPTKIDNSTNQLGLKRVDQPANLIKNSFFVEQNHVVVCLKVVEGRNRISFA